MRFALISTKHRKVFDLHVPVQIDEEFICNELRCDEATSVDLTDDMWLWVPTDPKLRRFQLMDGPVYYGDGMLCGRTRLGDVKSLPRHYCLEMVRKWFVFPAPRPNIALPRRQTLMRPTGFPLPALSVPTTELRHEARERAYI